MKDNQLVLLLGTNLGNRLKNLEQAFQNLLVLFGKPQLKSSIYESYAWGNELQPNFYNQVLVFNCNESASEVLDEILDIELKMGRERIEKWGSRIIDIDILFYNKEIIYQENLKIPHPFLHLRKFTLEPLNELMPDFIHPKLKKSISDLLIEVGNTDLLKVEKITQK